METSAPPRRAGRAWLTLPNVLSLLRLASVPVFLWLFVSGREDAAVLLYAVGASTDFFDGFIARRTASVTELGKILDPLADRVFIAALAVALVARQLLPLSLAIAIVGRDLLVVGLFPLLERRGIERIPVSFVGKTATASLLMGLTLLAVSATSLVLPGAEQGGLAFAIVGAILYWVAGAVYARQAAARVRDLSQGASR